MKNFVELFKQNHEPDIEILRRTANVAGRKNPEHWKDYVKGGKSFLSC